MNARDRVQRSAAGPARPGLVLAIDLGTSGPKAAVVGFDGAVHDSAFEPSPPQFGPDGGAEHDPGPWWEAVTRAVRAATAAHTAEISAVAVTGMWGGTVAVDEGGQAIGPALSWMDARGAPYVREIVGGRLRVAGYGPRRAVRWIRRTGGAPSPSGRDPVGHIQFLRNERPEIYRAAAYFLEPIDYLGLRLTGRPAATTATITLHWVTDTRDLARVDYDPQLLRQTGLERAKLPEIVPTGSMLGSLEEAPARQLGLTPGIPVLTALPDIMSGAIGSGAVGDGASHLYVGTSSWLSCHVAFKRTDALHSVATLPSGIPGRYLVCTEQQTAGRAVEWVRDAVAPGASFEALLEEAAQVPPGSDGVLFTPWLNGERTPVDDHRIRAAFTGLSLAHGRGHLARAVLEGVALNARWMQGYVEKLTRGPVGPLRFIGGGARSDLWCQILADVLGCTIERVVDPVNASLRGSALMAGLSLGEVELQDIPAIARVADRFEPRPEHHPVYQAQFTALRREYRAARRRARGAS